MKVRPSCVPYMRCRRSRCLLLNQKDSGRIVQCNSDHVLWQAVECQNYEWREVQKERCMPTTAIEIEIENREEV